MMGKLLSGSFRYSPLYMHILTHTSRCEHYSVRFGGTRDHLFSYEVGTGLYDVEYLEALFDNDMEEITRIENAACNDGFGPLALCSTTWNPNAIKVHCRELISAYFFFNVIKTIIPAACEHRDSEGNLVLSEMTRLNCQSTFRSFEPLEEYRHVCPQILIICRGEHTHPIPLPTKTPPSICAEISKLLQSLDQDLPDLTPHRFLRHSVTLAYLQKRCPAINNPNLADLHISLANREHVKTYILQVQKRCFPFGTGWKGMYGIVVGSCQLISFHRTLLPQSQSRRQSAARTTLHSVYKGSSYWPSDGPRRR
jgi:hypothetical protein